MADGGKIEVGDIGGVIDVALAGAVVGYVGAAETARALRGVIGEEAVREIERKMLEALDRMDAVPDAKDALRKEIQGIFAR